MVFTGCNLQSLNIQLFFFINLSLFYIYFCLFFYSLNQTLFILDSSNSLLQLLKASQTLFLMVILWKNNWSVNDWGLFHAKIIIVEIKFSKKQNWRHYLRIDPILNVMYLFSCIWKIRGTFTRVNNFTKLPFDKKNICAVYRFIS